MVTKLRFLHVELPFTRKFYFSAIWFFGGITVSFATRGIYSFDCLVNETGRGVDSYVYKIAAKPSKPIFGALIPSLISSLIPLKMQLDFETSKEIDIRAVSGLLGTHPMLFT